MHLKACNMGQSAQIKASADSYRPVGRRAAWVPRHARINPVNRISLMQRHFPDFVTFPSSNIAGAL
jgi:hypothetical protein